MGNSPIETLRQKSIKAALDSSDYYDYLNSGSFWERLDKRNPISRMTMPFVVQNIGSSPLLGTRYSSSGDGSFGGGASSAGHKVALSERVYERGRHLQRRIAFGRGRFVYHEYRLLRRYLEIR